ncbi:hypothetical protein AVEN_9088-1 [Araneus ventricosus]|uniref:Uncharacterized protein n=1 Tax=Araneus ventricosus TaxID=182803 RepID=A0A4Y2US24_ARAVE|nr:hypothetical protein AVEN_9088-1 [Araneus ventricosus]
MLFRGRPLVFEFGTSILLSKFTVCNSQPSETNAVKSLMANKENTKKNDLLQLMLDSSVSVSGDVDVSRLEAGNAELEKGGSEETGRHCTDLVIRNSGQMTSTITEADTLFKLPRHSKGTQEPLKPWPDDENDT